MTEMTVLMLSTSRGYASRCERNTLHRSVLEGARSKRANALVWQLNMHAQDFLADPVSTAGNLYSPLSLRNSRPCWLSIVTTRYEPHS